MEKYTQKHLRALVASGAAKDVTNTYDCSEIPESYSQIGYASGLYGCSGMLLQGESGKLYTVTKRTVTIYLFN